jgi:tetratricopeptide (TPR) repeat protein
MYFELGRLEESEKSFLTAIEIQQRAMPGSANRPEFRQQLALNYYNLTDILSTLGKSKEAESACAKALALKKELTEQFPARHEFQRDLAGSYHMGAMLHMSNGRLEPALSPCREAATIRKKLVAEFPVHFEMRQELGLSLNLLGLVLGKSGKPKEADDAYEECAAVQKKLVTDFPDVPDAHHDLAGTYVNRASLARNRKDYEQARKWLEEAQPFHLSALTSKPDHPGYRQYYLNNQTLLVLVNAEAGDPAAAIAAADQIPKLGWLPAANAYHAAMLMVACADMAGQNSKLNEADRKIQSQQYADQAMALLKLAVANGFSDATRLKSDPALKSIRAREDFGALLKQLQSK